MTDIGHNKPPYAVLELDNQEFKYLEKLFAKGLEHSNENFKNICEMSSTDARAKFRSVLSLGATVDISMYERLLEKLDRSVG